MHATQNISDIHLQDAYVLGVDGKSCSMVNYYHLP